MLNRSLSFFLSVLLFYCLSFTACSPNSKIDKSVAVSSKLPDTATALPPAPTLLNIVAVGDIMLGSAYKSENDLPADHALGSFKHVKDFLKEGDVIFGNVEGCFLDSGASTKCKEKKNCVAFRMPESYAQVFKDAGFNLLSLANNHSGDFGSTGRKTTLRRLEELDIKCGGLISHPSSILEVKGIKYGFCAFSPNEGTLSIYDYKNIATLIGDLKSKTDIVIVSFHAGGEGKAYQHVTRKTDFFYSEDRANVYLFAHHAIDSGADLVLGQGPHVTRAVEVYNKKFIAYSLGNFCTYGLFNLDGPNGYAPLMNIRITREGDFMEATVHSVKQTKLLGLMPDSANRAFNRMLELTNEDFPEHLLTFRDNSIYIKQVLQ